MNIYFRQKQRGLTLVELMISLALGLALTAGAITIFQQNKETYNFQESISRIQESARFAMEIMARDIRSSGFRGCRSRMAQGNSSGIHSVFRYPIETSFNESSEVINFQRGLSGYEAVGVSGNADDWEDWETPAGDLDASIDARNPNGGSDIIVLRSVKGTNRSATMAACADDDGAGDITLSADLGSELQQFDIAVVSNCESASVFVVTNDPTGDTTVSHDATTSSGAETSRYMANLGNNDATFSICYGEDGVADGSSLNRIVNIVYFIADGFSGRPALFRMENGGAATELIEGIEEMQILYGEDTDVNGAVDTYATANNVGNWSNVLAVRLNLLVQSLDDNVVPTPQTLYFDRDGDDQVDTTDNASNGDRFVAPDNRVRRVFTTTIALRNRVS